MSIAYVDDPDADKGKVFRIWKADIFDVCENRGLHFSCNPLFLIFRGYLIDGLQFRLCH